MTQVLFIEVFEKWTSLVKTISSLGISELLFDKSFNLLYKLDMLHVFIGYNYFKSVHVKRLFYCDNLFSFDLVELFCQNHVYHRYNSMNTNTCSTMDQNCYAKSLFLEAFPFC